MKALVDSTLLSSINNNILKHRDGINLSACIQPASMDIPVGSECYHIKHKFIPFQDSVQYVTDKLLVEKFSTKDGIVLYKGQTYLFPCLDIDLPAHYFGKVSPKSSLGRIDVLIRAVVDQTGMYDTILPGTAGQLRLEVTPQSFNIKVHQGTTLSQLMLFDLEQHADPYDRSAPFLFIDGKQQEPLFYEDKMAVSIGIGNEATIGYVARYTNEVIDLSLRAHYPRHRFFQEVHMFGSGDRKKITLEKDRFYILPTKEAINVPPQYAIELVPSTHLVGELRVHYAGFFDPGFGGGTGGIGVLEIRTHEDTIVYDGQPICLMEVYTNEKIPNALYGQAGNNYHMQNGVRLSKYFRNT